MIDAGLATALMFAAVARSLTGTIVSIEPSTPPKLMVQAEGQFQTFVVARRAVIERETKFKDDSAATKAKISLSDLTPGEYVKLEIDAKGRVTYAQAVVLVERAKVRSVNGSSVVLEDGTTLTIGSVLRFVTEDGKPSATATVRPGENVLLFRHPETRNIYRFSPDAHPRLHGSARGHKHRNA